MCCSSIRSRSKSIEHSLVYAALAASLAVAFGLTIAYIAQRRLTPIAPVLVFLAMAPFVIPGIVLAIGFYAAYGPPPLSLNGTATILILAFAVRFLPIAYANCAAAMRSINPEMEEAGRIFGSTRAAVLRRIVAPMLKRSLAGAWLLAFIPATREVSTAVFLVGAHTRVLSVLMLDLSEEGMFEALAALGTILLLVTVAIVAMGLKALGRDFMLNRA